MKRLIKKAEGEKIELMHGTSSTFIDSILKEGLLPEGFTGNSMFNYNDYGRKGEPKHPECVYLTKTLENAQRYSANAVKHNEGFPIIIKVTADPEFLTWDDDAFYKNFGKFDLGETDEMTGDWVRKPDKEYWEQSIEINDQCAHYGKVPPEQFLEFYINGKWVKLEDFNEIYSNYKSMSIKALMLHENPKYDYKEYKIDAIENTEFVVTVIGRSIYFRNLQFFGQMNDNQGHAFSLKVMEFLKSKIKEFGAKIHFDPSFRKVGLNPKDSSFNYVFGMFEVTKSDDAYNEIMQKLDDRESSIRILESIINCHASEEEFLTFYDKSIDFTGDLVDYCKKTLSFNDTKLLEVLKNIKKTYSDSYNQIQAEIEYIEHRISNPQTPDNREPNDIESDVEKKVDVEDSNKAEPNTQIDLREPKQQPVKQPSQIK